MPHTRSLDVLARRATRLAQAIAPAVALLVGLASCQSPQEPRTAIGATLVDAPLGPSAIPDSITRSPGLPPRSGDSTTRVLGPMADTLVQTSLRVAPPWSVAASQVAPGAPTQGGMRIEVRVLSRTPNPNMLVEVPLPLTACPIALRLYRAGDHRAASVWRSDAASPPQGCPPLQRYGSSDVTASWDVAALLGDSLPPGRYDVSYDVRLTDGRVLTFSTGGGYLTGDATPPTRDFAALRYAVATSIEGAGPRTLKTTVWVRNPTARWLEIAYGACALQLHLFRTAARTGSPLWRSEERRSPGTNIGYGCPAVLYGTTLAPGDSLPLRLTVPLPEILSDTVAPGRYYGTAALALLDGSQSVATWRRDVALDAGAIDLPGGPDLLPAVRLVDSVRVEATTRLVRAAGGADTVRTLAMFTNTAAESRTLDVPPDCPVIVYAYHSAAQRDAVPIANPAWRTATTCALVSRPFTLAPGASWVFQHDVPAATLRASLGTGRVWFTAWLAGTPNVMLAAGDIVVP